MQLCWAAGLGERVYSIPCRGKRHSHTSPPPPSTPATSHAPAHLPARHAAGELLAMAEPHLDRHLHPTVVIRGYLRALEDALKIIDSIAFPIDTRDRQQARRSLPPALCIWSSLGGCGQHRAAALITF